MLRMLIKILSNSLFFTILIELSVSIILKVKDKKDLLNIVLVNIVTNPIVVLFPYIIGLFYGLKYRLIMLLLLEIFAFVFEGYIYKKYLKYNKINPFILSLLLNISSYLLGDIINLIIY